jgi:tRNA (guanine6-N2)-methyltransferase
MHITAGSAARQSTHPHLPLLARTVRGIEWIAAPEIRAKLASSDIQRDHREIRFSLAELSPAVLELGTVDDVYLVATTVGDIGHQRRELRTLRAIARTIDLDSFAAVVTALRPAPRTREFDIAASFLGRRNYNRHEIEDAFGHALAARNGWAYLTRAHGRIPPHSGLSLGIHLAGSRATVAVRIAPHPLHRRPYRVATRPGSLRPTIACAIGLLVGLRPGCHFVDPFCGAGTIPIEAKLACPKVLASGFDISDEAIASPRANAAAARVNASFLSADVTALPVHDGAIDRVATNPPWGEAVVPDGRRVTRPVLGWRELARVLKPDGRAVALVPPDIQRSDFSTAGLSVVLRNRIRVAGALADALVLIPRGSTQHAVDSGALFSTELQLELELTGQSSWCAR